MALGHPFVRFHETQEITIVAALRYINRPPDDFYKDEADWGNLSNFIKKDNHFLYCFYGIDS